MMTYALAFQVGIKPIPQVSVFYLLRVRADDVRGLRQCGLQGPCRVIEVAGKQRSTRSPWRTTSSAEEASPLHIIATEAELFGSDTDTDSDAELFGSDTDAELFGSGTDDAVGCAAEAAAAKYIFAVLINA